MKPYNITTTRIQGQAYKQIKFSKDYVTIFNVKWRDGDTEAEQRAIRSADICVIKQNLNYATRKLKKI